MMRMLSKLIIFLLVLSVFATEENDIKFDKRLRKLARRMKHQSSQIKEDVLTEIRKLLNSEKMQNTGTAFEDESVTELKRDLVILKQAFSQMTTEVTNIKRRLQDVEGEKRTLQQALEKVAYEGQQQFKHLEIQTKELASNLNDTDSKLSNLSEYHDNLDKGVDNISMFINSTRSLISKECGKVQDFAEEQHANVTEKVNILSLSLYSHVNNSIMHVIDNIRLELIHLLEKPVSRSVLQYSSSYSRMCSENTFQLYHVSDYDEKKQQKQENNILILSAINTSHANNSFTIVDIRNMSQTVMNVTTFIEYIPATSTVYDHLTRSIIWGGTKVEYDFHWKYKTYRTVRERYIRRKIHKIFITKDSSNDIVPTGILFSTSDPVTHMALDSYRGLLFYISNTNIYTLKTNGMDHVAIISYNPFVTCLVLDVVQQLILYNEKDRILSMTYEGRNKNPVVVTPKKVTTIALSSDRDTLFYDQGSRLIMFSMTGRNPIVVAQIPHHQWKLLHIYEDTLYVSYWNSSMFKCDSVNIKDGTLYNVY